MNNKQLAALFKNLICAAIGLLVLFITSIFVIKGVLQSSIDTRIDDATILKEYFQNYEVPNTLLGDSFQVLSMPPSLKKSHSIISLKMYHLHHLE